MFSRPRTQVRSKNPVQGRAPGRAGQLVAYGRLFISNVSFYYYPGLIDFSNINYSRTLWGGGKRICPWTRGTGQHIIPRGIGHQRGARIIISLGRLLRSCKLHLQTVGLNQVNIIRYCFAATIPMAHLQLNKYRI